MAAAGALREAVLMPVRTCARLPSPVLIVCVEADRCLGRGNACNRDTERTAGHVVEPEIVEKPYGARVPTVLAADAVLDALFHCAAFAHGYFHQAAHGPAVE